MGAEASAPEAPLAAAADRGPIVLFDGVCNLCNAAVSFVIDNDPHGRVRFASLQSAAGRELLALHGLPSLEQAVGPGTLYLLDGGKAYAHSTAALRLARYLGGLWPVAGALLYVPAGLRNAVYDFIAARRYLWFGRTESCRLPTPDEAGRFLG